MIFADHESLSNTSQSSSRPDSADPWASVCEAAGLVFDFFRRNRDLSMRDTASYSMFRLFATANSSPDSATSASSSTTLRSAVPREPVLEVVGFAAAVTACHNYLLRSMIKGDEDATA